MKTEFVRKTIGLVFVIMAGLCFAGCATPGQNKDKADLYLRLGVSHLEKGQFPLALTNLLKSEELNSRNPILHNALGLTYFYRNREDLAEKSFLKSLELDPKATETRNNYARMLIGQKKYSAALTQLNLAVDDLKYPFPNKSYFNLGFLYFEIHKYEQAISAFEKSLSFKNDDCLTATYYGRSFLELKRYASANSAFENALPICQAQLVDDAHYYSAVALYRMGEARQAESRFRETYSLFPEGKYREKARAMLDILHKANQ